MSPALAVVVSAHVDAAAEGLTCLFLIVVIGAAIGAFGGALFGLGFWIRLRTDDRRFWERAAWGERWIPRVTEILAAVGGILALIFHGWIHRLLGLGVALALLLAPMRPLAWDRSWSRTDTALEATYGTLLAIDYLQSLTIAREGLLETNPILGHHPSTGRVTSYFATAAVLHALGAWLLPSGRARTLWQGAAIGMEIGATVHNARLNVGLSVPW